ncbi:MAG: DUF3990 domain-containing protein [Defluviitaleaceae bacterium]|nr:DUF3990 domain-containing protein [Defluviitaleaceae bacterium]MCL2274545.1 DUF3990 domain-containing protein [Defluviitaleaceae bacterium]
MKLFHGGATPVRTPEIRKAKYTKDFGTGFYCTEFEQQAKIWSTKKSMIGYISSYEYTASPNLTVKHFTENDEWLDFVVACRRGEPHNYDIVEGPMADDKIWNEIDDFIASVISRAAFWELIKFAKPTHQISFHNEDALQTLTFIGEVEVTREKQGIR